ncbi:MAG: OsmC family protein [Thioalkalivibrio sp.]
MMESEANHLPVSPPSALARPGDAKPPSSGTMVLRRGADGQLQLETHEPHHAGVLGLRPVEHLAVALGGCLCEFAVRFLERRQLPTSLYLELHWRVSVQQCCIDTIEVRLRVEATLDEMGRQTLKRMLDECPVHKALHGNVEVVLEVVEGRDEG